MKNLFCYINTYDCESREFKAKIFLQKMLLNIMRNCKNNHILNATESVAQLDCVILYMFIVGDIDDFTYNKLRKLSLLICRKYRL